MSSTPPPPLPSSALRPLGSRQARELHFFLSLGFHEQWVSKVPRLLSFLLSPLASPRWQMPGLELHGCPLPVSSAHVLGPLPHALPLSISVQAHWLKPILPPLSLQYHLSPFYQGALYLSFRTQILVMRNPPLTPTKA